MPNSSSFLTVVLVWLFRAWAFRRCAYLILLAVLSSSLSTSFGSEIHHDRTKADIAVCSWQTVSSGFFFRPSLPHARQEQVTHGRDDQVASQPQVAAALVLIQADLALVVLEAPLHAPAREGHQQEDPHRRPRRRVADEELHLLGIQDVAGDHQAKPLAGEAVGVRGRDHDMLTFPHHGALLAVLDVVLAPGLVAQPRVLEQLVDPPGGPAAA